MHLNFFFFLSLSFLNSSVEGGYYSHSINRPSFIRATTSETPRGTPIIHSSRHSSLAGTPRKGSYGAISVTHVAHSLERTGAVMTAAHVVLTPSPHDDFISGSPADRVAANTHLSHDHIQHEENYCTEPELG